MAKHAGGYSGMPVDREQECVHATGMQDVLCLAWKNDNAGPPNASEVIVKPVLLYVSLMHQFACGVPLTASGYVTLQSLSCIKALAICRARGWT